MSGICGIVDYDGVRLAAARDQSLQSVLQALRHRGPDSSETRFAPPAILGATCRTLARDSANWAAQPITRPSDSLTLVLDGAIYNSLELRQDLESHGEVSELNSDAEIL